VLRPALALVLVASALALAGPAPAATTQLLPRVTYETNVQFTPHGPVAMHVVRGPRPVGLYRLRPVLSNGMVIGRETVSSMQRRLTTQATTVGVNGDFYASKKGGPSGIFMRDGALVSAPSESRSSAGITFDGLLDVRRVRLFGTWRGLGQRRAINVLNEAPGANGLALFTPDWGPTTPRVPGGVAVVVSPFEAAAPNLDLFGQVVDLRQSPSVPIAPGTAVLVARGSAAQKLAAEAPLGTFLTIRLILQPEWETVGDAIGGGPVLVRDGVPVFRANEAFTTQQLAPRHPRSAVGQTADGRIILVAVDGRQAGYSVGMTTFELAQALARLGAVRAMALDGGGSTTLAFEGTVFNRPSDGRERSVSDALLLFYSGVYAPPPAETVYSPNGDGVAEEQALAYKIVRPSNVTVTLTAPGNVVAFQETVAREPGTYDVQFPPVAPPPLPPPEGVPPPPPPPPEPPAEGRWTLQVSATDDEALHSSTTRRFWVNSTLGFLQVQPRVLRVPPRGRSATIGWTQTRAAQVTVTVETMSGIPVRTVARRRFEPGQASVTWNGLTPRGRQVFGGLYRIRVSARNEVGSVSLDQQLRVRRIARAR
jgi:Phosphodiester glycosidase/FlgD Ig-like domain